MRALVLLPLLLLACGGTPPPPEPPAPQHEGDPDKPHQDLLLSTQAFPRGGVIPSTYTCEGGDISPPLDWQRLPPSAVSLALIIEDPDAPDPADPQTIWTHWVLYNLPPEDNFGLPEAVRHLPPGTLEGKNDWGRTGYGGPCPPIGEHRYMHKLYALDTMLPDLGEPDREALIAAMQGHILQVSTLIGTYEKSAK